ncbi:MAG TPA: LuxR C-terminal-related transcriptional regulator [Mycobacteriales bacterium]|nr:LuxR C-terminal-related transcriptional regulator [Mycobacteriales bacterium]
MPVTDLRFSVPFLPPQHLPRPRLLATVDAARSSALTLVSAGAGAGKTVLLTDWAQRLDTPVVWLALTRADNDPRRFWRLLLEGGRTAGQVYPPAAWTSGRTVELLDFVLGRAPPSQPRLQVVLDDAHVLTDPQVLDGLDRIIRRWPHRIRLLATARSDPLLPLHRYRLAGQVCEIRAADLAMTVPEARDLLHAHGLALREDDLRTLVDRTEGWSAGLRLAALRMRGAGRPADFVADLAIDQSSVGEYLTEEVLAVQPESVRRLLIETSFLDQVSGPLADAITGADDGEAVLTALARNNSFVIPLDAGRTVFRYHQLFREMLRHLAAREPAELVRSRYLAAAECFREHDDLSSALRWTIRSRDPGAIRSLLVHAGLAEVFVSRPEIAPDEVRGLGDAVSAEDAPAPEGPEADVARWAVAALAADTATAPAELARLPPLGDGPESVAADLRVTASLAELILGQKAGDIDRLDAAAERLLTEPELSAPVRDVPGLRASVLLAQARSRFTAGRLPEVEPLLHRALLTLETDQAPEVELDVVSMLAFVCVSAGRPRQAEDALDRAAALLAGRPELTRPVILDLAVARHAEVAADLTAMGAAVGRVLAAGPIYPDNGTAATVAFVQASYLAAVGDLPAARTVLRDNRALNSGTVGLLGIMRDCALAEVEVRLGRPQSALRLLDRHRRPPFDVIAGLPAATAYLALGDLRRAEASVRTVLSTPSPFVSLRLTVEALLCEAAIAVRRGAESQAAEMLDRALQMTDGDLALPFVRSADTFAPLLARHPTVAARWPAAVSGPVPAVVRPPRTGGRELADPLTSREQAVLRLMATSMSTVDMAEELHLSVNTVKTHLASIYRKLGVGRRREAVLQARDNELL